MKSTRLGLAVVATVALPLLSTPPAVADPATDFLTNLRASGFDPGTTPYDEAMALVHASTACNIMHYDYTPTQARDYLRNQYPGVALVQLSTFVNVAQQTLCNAQYAPVKPDW